MLLPIITSRGVIDTHDVRHRVPHGRRGPARIRPIPQEHIQEVIPVTDGGAKHRYIDPPTEPHNVADPHAVAKVHTVAGPALLTPHSARFGRTMYILTPKHSILVKIS